MKLFHEKQEDYRKNLACMEEVTDRLLGHMKGHGCSFRQKITESKGNFSQEKLCGLVKELLNLWAETLRENTDTDPGTGESLAESYIRERRELYGLYLYLVMRCSLCEGAYAKAYPYGFVDKERTDFAFLLEQARRLSRRWCVMAGPDGEKRNELYEGYDEHFGFHLYKTLMDPEGITDDSALSPWWKRQNNLDSLTNEGNMKRIYIRHLSGSSPGSRGNETAPGVETATDEETVPGKETALGGETAPAKETAAVKAAVRTEEMAQATDYHDEVETDDTGSDSGYEDDYDGDDNHEDDDAYMDYDDYDDYNDDPYPFPDFETKAEFKAARMEQWAQEAERADYLSTLALNFACEAEYLEACRRFTVLFEKARPEILRDFHQELEKIVNLYLAERDFAPLADTDKTLDVYSRVSDGPCQQASSYERRLQWENQ